MMWTTVAMVALGCVLSVAGKSSPVAKEWCDSELSEVTRTELCWRRYHDLDSDVSWGYIFPTHASPKGHPLTEFIGILSAPASAGWVGNSFGGSPLGLVGWLDGNSPSISIRRMAATQIPNGLPNPVVTLLSESGLTSSGHQRYIYRCQNCVSWSEGAAGSLNMNGTALFGFAAHTSTKPSNPSSPNTGLPPPNLAGRHFVDIKSARTPSYWRQLAVLLGDP